MCHLSTCVSLGRAAEAVGSTLGGWIGQLIIGFIGACILIAIARAVRGRA